MRAVVTRVSSATVSIDGSVAGRINQGLLVLLGIAPSDTPQTAAILADKITGLRIFGDESGKMNRNLSAVGGDVLVISQFTLFANLKSRRPGFSNAAKPDIAIPLYELFVDLCRQAGFETQTGVFGADMAVSSVNDGPVTIVFDTDCL